MQTGWNQYASSFFCASWPLLSASGLQPVGPPEVSPYQPLLLLNTKKVHSIITKLSIQPNDRTKSVSSAKW